MPHPPGLLPMRLGLPMRFVPLALALSLPLFARFRAATCLLTFSRACLLREVPPISPHLSTQLPTLLQATVLHTAPVHAAGESMKRAFSGERLTSATLCDFARARAAKRVGIRPRCADGVPKARGTAAVCHFIPFGI